MNREEIIELCDKYGIENYTITGDELVDVDGDVIIFDFELTSIPLNFGKVSGYFQCGLNRLVSLKGCPKEVGSHFSCSDNYLTSLEGCPIRIGGSFYCGSNLLESLDGCPAEVGGNFFCCGNNLFDVSYIHLFELGYDVDKIKCDIDLTLVKRMWFINGIINE